MYLTGMMSRFTVQREAREKERRLSAEIEARHQQGQSQEAEEALQVAERQRESRWHAERYGPGDNRLQANAAA